MLNPAQKTVVDHRQGPILVVAGAGTGKTHTLTSRVAALIEEGVPAERILLLTFTRKAAGEMMERCGQLLGFPHGCRPALGGGTFHAAAFADLKRLGKLRDLYGLCDEAEGGKQLTKLLNLPEFKVIKDSKLSRRQLLQILSLAKNTCQDLAATVKQFFSAHIKILAEIDALLSRFEAEKKARGMMDYDDILVAWLALLRSDDGEACRNVYDYVLVDEYQDTSRLQVEILRSLVCGHRNIMAVGDDCQSIYSFRGALAAQLKEFLLDFPGARCVALEANYRSTEEILDFSNQVIAEAADVLPKELRSALGHKGPEPDVFRAERPGDVARRIADEIEKQHRTGTPLLAYAILFRSSAHAISLEMELNRRHLPYRKFGGQKLTEAAHVKDFLALLLLLHAASAPAWALERSMSLLPGIGEKSASRLAQSLSEGEAWDKLKFPAKAQPLAARIGTLRRPQEDEAMTKDAIKLVLDVADIILRENYDDADERFDDLKTIGENLSQSPSLRIFCTDMALDYGDTPDRDDKGPSDYLTLSTIHSAKGKEWDEVHILNVAQGAIPSMTSFGNAAKYEEERRLFYVAITRARKRLLLHVPRDDGFGNFQRPSEFIDTLLAGSRPAPRQNDSPPANYRTWQPVPTKPKAPPPRKPEPGDDYIYIYED